MGIRSKVMGVKSWMCLATFWNFHGNLVIPSVGKLQVIYWLDKNRTYNISAVDMLIRATLNRLLEMEQDK